MAITNRSRKFKQRKEASYCRYIGFKYRAASWNKKRRVIAKIEITSTGELVRFLVTNQKGLGQEVPKISLLDFRDDWKRDSFIFTSSEITPKATVFISAGFLSKNIHKPIFWAFKKIQNSKIRQELAYFRGGMNNPG